tara:strand:+ start:201 stop:1094 length:894 start_codon:yes stop_codon:yes gene_type:complete
MIRLLSLLTFALVGTMTSKPLQAKGFDKEKLEKNRSLPFTLRWKKLRIAEMFFSISGDNDEYWKISGRTLGPLRLVKNYEGEAIQLHDTTGQKYRLEGRDQGFLESRDILFRSGDLPLVKEFVDRTAETSLTPELSWGKFAISPMGLFRQIVNSTRLPSLCSGSIIIYDGKRAYTVKLEGSRAQYRDLRILDLSEFKERVFWKCSAILDSSTLIQRSRDLDTESKETLKELVAKERVDNDIPTDLRWSKVWLFSARDRRIDFILSVDCGSFELVGLLISSPMGRIIGKPPSSCEVTN